MKRKQPNFPGTSFEDESEPVCVAVVTSRPEAELIVGMLRSGGLRAAVSEQGAGGRHPELQLHGVQVLVARADEAEARQCLADIEANPPEVEDNPDLACRLTCLADAGVFCGSWAGVPGVSLCMSAASA